MRATAFMMLAFAKPSMVGALLPSSRGLARAMAREADGAELVIELGAGTGAITEALRQREPQRPMVAVELQPELAEHLATRFPDVDVRAEPAHKVLRGLQAAKPRVVVVSSLPFRSLPRRWRDSSSLAIEHYLLADARRHLVQYTYQPRAPFDLQHSDRLGWHKRRIVWRNAPPAWVWVLQNHPAAA
jgi:phosphatidylethanolamine/phosphatidyl-N-methylethanolamine N-methyltransferase